VKRFAAAVLTAALCFSLAGCRPQSTPQTVRCEETFWDLFDTVITVSAYRADQAAFHAEAQAAYDQLAFYHRLYDVYNDYEGLNNLKTVNDNAGVAPVEVDRAIIDLLLEAREMYALTGGRVNVAMGSVLSIWHQYRQDGLADPDHAALPPMDDLRLAAAHTGIEAVVIDETASTVYLSDPDLRLDVGAIAKGYAAERTCQALTEQGYTSLLLNVGGNLRAVGGKDGAGAPWRLGIQDPAGGAQDYLWAAELAGGSLVTSGSYQRYYTVDGVDYCHIIDPDTLMPAAFCVSVTVCTEDSGRADALSTALFTLPPEEGLALVDSLEGVEALWVLSDGTYQATDGFPGGPAA